MKNNPLPPEQQAKLDAIQKQAYANLLPGDLSPKSPDSAANWGRQSRLQAAKLAYNKAVMSDPVLWSAVRQQNANSNEGFFKGLSNAAQGFGATWTPSILPISGFSKSAQKEANAEPGFGQVATGALLGGLAGGLSGAGGAGAGATEGGIAANTAPTLAESLAINGMGAGGIGGTAAGIEAGGGVGGGAGTVGGGGIAAATPAASGLSNLFGSGVGVSDLAPLIAPVLDAYGNKQTADAQSALADKYMGFGEPSRARYEASYQPGFTMANDPGYQGALDQSAKATLHGLSTQGNPSDSPNAWAQSLSDLYNKTAYPALQDYRTTNATTGSLAAAFPAGVNSANDAINSTRNIYGDIGYGANTLSNIFNPAPKYNPVTGARIN